MPRDRSYKWGWHPDRPWDGVRTRAKPALGSTPSTVAAEISALRRQSAPLTLCDAKRAFDNRDTDTGLFALIKSLGQFMIGYEQQGSVQVVGVLPHLGAEDVRQMARETSGLVRLTERKRYYDVISQLYDLVDLYTADDPPSVILTLQMDRRQVFNRRWAECP